jgi:tRNA pseudouridine55 synthase
MNVVGQGTDPLSGFLIIDKPSGVTSFSMVALVRRLTGVKRVGHAGTLDPLATGVLPVAVGQAARLIEYMDDASKTYVARVRFGVTTDTYDAEGEVTATCDASGVTAEAVGQALPAFVGDILQTPPLYSAIKVAGKPLYKYAREGEAVKVAARLVRVDGIDLRSFDAAVAEAEMEVRCGKGTYIRSLAHDLGARLGCGAHLSALRRTSSGGFGIEDAHAPAELEGASVDGRLLELLLAADRSVERRPAAIFAADHTLDVRSGREVRMESVVGADLCRAYTLEGELVGMLRRLGEGVWRPEKVLSRA